jgi:hypothetical protein
VDGSFFVSVEGKEHLENAEKGELRVVDDRDLDGQDCTSNHATDSEATDEAASAGDGNRIINLTMLKSMLRSFGVLKSFSSVESTLDKNEVN